LKSDTILIKSDKFTIKLNHLIIIGVLILAFSTSMLIRSQPIEYGMNLNEFDPFFNYRATEYILQNGLVEYFEWHDEKTWYPDGRNVSSTSQVMLHITAAFTYNFFGGNTSVYDFTILFPAIIGSLTVIVIFALLRLFAGTTAGLISSLLFAVSLPIILRGTAGWFKSEPLGIFYGLLGLYLFLSGIKSENKKISFVKIILAGITMSFGLASWGGNQFFIIPLGLFILALPFVRKDHKFLVWAIPLFITTLFAVSLLFERPGYHFLTGIGGLSLIIPTVFLFVCIFVQKISSEKNKIRNSLLFLLSIILFSSFVLILEDNQFNIIDGNTTYRYFNAINPFLTSTNPLVDSVAEHANANTQLSFYLHSTWLIFSGIGIWLILSKKIPQTKIFEHLDLRIFVLIIGIVGVYVSSVFIRLEVFASISLIILSSISLSILIKEIFKMKSTKNKNLLLKISSITIFSFLLIIPLFYPLESNWLVSADYPPVIFTGATSYPPTNDWLETMEWIKSNTPENAKIASWWDYGYWITAFSERITYVDNATLNTEKIKNMATMFMSPPEESWKILKEMDADYVVVFFAAQDIGNRSQEQPLYVTGGGGDESKILWMSKIAEIMPKKFLESDYKTPTPYFYENTMLGKMIPFTPVVYYHPLTETNSQIYQNGFVEISLKNIKYNSNNDPVKLVYSSPSYLNDDDGETIFVLVYEVNKNYNPSDYLLE